MTKYDAVAITILSDAFDYLCGDPTAESEALRILDVAIIRVAEERLGVQLPFRVAGPTRRMM